MNYNPFKSKTNITIAIAVALAVANALVPFLSPDWQAAITSFLGVLAVVFHTNTAVNSGAKN